MLFMKLYVPEFGAGKFRIVMSSWIIVPLTTMKYPSLYSLRLFSKSVVLVVLFPSFLFKVVPIFEGEFILDNRKMDFVS